MDSRIIIRDDEGNDIELFVLEQTRIGGRDYILTTDAADGEDGECYVLKDMSEPGDAEAVYRFVEDDGELEGLFRIFTELMGDSDTALSL